MTTKPRARKFRIRRDLPLGADLPPAAPAAAPAVAPAAEPAADRPEAPPRPAARGGALRALVLRPETHHAGPPDPRAEAPAAEPAPPPEVDGPGLAHAEDGIDAIRREGLTGRQLRMARRVAQKHGLPVASDFDAVRQLRARGIDPFQQSNLLELVQGGRFEGEGEGMEAGGGMLPAPLPRATLPATARGAPVPGPARTPRPAADPAAAERRASEILRIQRDIARRRRRRLLLLAARLAAFVLLPTLLVGWYFAREATPMYSTNAEFVIQQAEPSGAAGLGGLFQGTSMATQQDSMTVQAYLASRAALERLDADHGFRAAFSAPVIDPIQRLAPDASNEDLYGLYKRHVKIAYDPTEGIIKMEVIAPDPAMSERFSEALIGYAEEQVDQLTQRLREDAMAGARQNYEDAEGRRMAALQDWLRIQQQVQQIDPVGETAARTSQISALETERQQLQLELQTRLSVAQPNEAQVGALRTQIANIEGLIANLRTEMTQASEQGASLAERNTELRLAEENYTFQTVQVQAAMTAMEAAQVEANRQVRYLSLGVEPVAPDEATYPRAFENTVLAFLVLSGLYLMVSLTASILREQVTS